MTDPLDHPWDEMLLKTEALTNAGGDFYQKWTCEGCGTRQTMTDKNVVFTYGKCEECEHVTNLRKNGFGFMAVFGIGEPDDS